MRVRLDRFNVPHDKAVATSRGGIEKKRRTDNKQGRRKDNKRGRIPLPLPSPDCGQGFREGESKKILRITTSVSRYKEKKCRRPASDGRRPPGIFRTRNRKKRNDA